MINQNTSCYIIAGHYGSGKTEIADNLALCFAKHKETVIADLDIVNPYFRTRECERLLAEYGVKVYSSNIHTNPYEDTPGIAPEISSCFLRRDRISLIDLGGDSAGARVLGRYKKIIPKDAEMWMVVNGNRHYTQDAKSALAYLKDMEAEALFRFTGLINNTHSCEETTVEDIKKGDHLVRELSEICGLPVIACCFRTDLSHTVQQLDTAGEKFPLTLMHRPQWMKYA